MSHFGTKVQTELREGGGGRLVFDFGECDLESSPSGIRLTATATSREDLAKLQDVVARHLVRFGSVDELHVSWADSIEGEPGSLEM